MGFLSTKAKLKSWFPPKISLIMMSDLPTEVIIKIFDELPVKYLVEVFLPQNIENNSELSQRQREMIFATLSSYFKRTIYFKNSDIEVSFDEIDDRCIMLNDLHSTISFHRLLQLRSTFGSKNNPVTIIMNVNVSKLQDIYIVKSFLKLIRSHFDEKKLEFKFQIARFGERQYLCLSPFKFPAKVSSLKLIGHGDFYADFSDSSCLETIELFNCKPVRVLDLFPHRLKKFSCTSSNNHREHVIMDPNTLPSTVEILSIGSKVILSNSGYTMPNLRLLRINNAYSRTKEFFRNQRLQNLVELRVTRLPITMDQFKKFENLKTLVCVNYKFPTAYLNLPQEVEYLYFIKCQNVNLNLIYFPQNLKKLMLPHTDENVLANSSIPNTLDTLLLEPRSKKLFDPSLDLSVQVNRHETRLEKKYLKIIKKK